MNKLIPHLKASIALLLIITALTGLLTLLILYPQWILTALALTAFSYVFYMIYEGLLYHFK